jgi:hypothetical protein
MLLANIHLYMGCSFNVTFYLPFPPFFFFFFFNLIVIIVVRICWELHKKSLDNENCKRSLKSDLSHSLTQPRDYSSTYLSGATQKELRQ